MRQWAHGYAPQEKSEKLEAEGSGESSTSEKANGKRKNEFIWRHKGGNEGCSGSNGFGEPRKTKEKEGKENGEVSRMKGVSTIWICRRKRIPCGILGIRRKRRMGIGTRKYARRGSRRG